MVDESSCTRHRQVSDERIFRRNHWSDLGRHTTPAGNAIGVALELETMPVYRRSVVSPVVDRYVSWDVAMKDEDASSPLHRIDSRWSRAALQYVRHGHRRTACPRFLVRKKFEACSIAGGGCRETL